MTDVVKEQIEIPTSEEVYQMPKKQLIEILNEVCAQLYEAVGPKRYSDMVFPKVRALPQGLHNFRVFVSWAIDLLLREKNCHFATV